MTCYCSSGIYLFSIYYLITLMMRWILYRVTLISCRNISWMISVRDSEGMIQHLNIGFLHQNASFVIFTSNSVCMKLTYSIVLEKWIRPIIAQLTSSYIINRIVIRLQIRRFISVFHKSLHLLSINFGSIDYRHFLIIL